MPARRKPTAILEASGAFDRNPKRRMERAEEPKSNGPIGDPPSEFLRDTPEWKKHLAAWNHIIAITPEGVLTKADHIHVEQTARQLVKCQSLSARAADRMALMQMYGRLGLTPADRSRVAAKKVKDADKRSPEGWEGLAHEAAAGRLQ